MTLLKRIGREFLTGAFGTRVDAGCLTCDIQRGAGDGNRTRMASLEGWGSAIELHPRGRRGYQRRESRRRSVRRMHFAGATQDAVADGRVDLTFRLWSRPQAKVGGRYRVGAVTIEVDEMELVPFGTVTAAEARRSGYDDREALRAITATRDPVRRRHARLPHRVPRRLSGHARGARSTSALSVS